MHVARCTWGYVPCKHHHCHGLVTLLPGFYHIIALGGTCTHQQHSCQIIVSMLAVLCVANGSNGIALL
jgi:hypothetical protein